MRGNTTRTVKSGGASRSYVAYLPTSLNPMKPAPLVYVFHGATMTGGDMYAGTGYPALADTEGIAVVFPDGQGVSSAAHTSVLNPWNVSDGGTPVCGTGNLVNNANAVDLQFMNDIKADVLQDQCIDEGHVFATGFSMGGYFSHHVACDRPDIKGVGPHSGGTIASLSGCATTHKPIIMLHGTGDTLIAPGCDDPASPAQAGFTPAATLWAQKNGCKSTYTMMAENGSGGGNGQCYLYDGCPPDGQVELCTFTGMGHCWAGGTTGAYSCPTYASATALEWAFWKKYAW
jgi:polyhydroxybutyrate depolymerase